ncbi:hypothetical protein, partial [Cerasicoccus maritimus]|uniref:hypothetical protein n=1 Tax=Cerasicoccus maritimus TaxID=490089 RepID=UPI002852A57D
VTIYCHKIHPSNKSTSVKLGHQIRQAARLSSIFAAGTVGVKVWFRPMTHTKRYFERTCKALFY